MNSPKTVGNNPSFFHVYNRGVAGQPIFKSDDNYRYLLTKAREHADQHQVLMIAYCLMPTHYHFLIRSETRAQVAKFIQAIFNSYAQAFNRQQNRSGTLFESRAKFKRIETDEYILQLCRYIHLNPVEAGLVKNPEDWEFSDYTAYISRGSAGLQDHNLISDYFQNPKQYKEFVKSSLAKGSVANG